MVRGPGIQPERRFDAHGVWSGAGLSRTGDRRPEMALHDGICGFRLRIAPERSRDMVRTAARLGAGSGKRRIIAELSIRGCGDGRRGVEGPKSADTKAQAKRFPGDVA